MQINTYEQNKIIELSLNTLLEFYETSLTLINDNLTRNFGDIGGKHIGEALFKFQNETNDLFIKQNILYHKLLVFLGTEKEIIDKAFKLGEASTEVQKVFRKHFGAIKYATHKEIEALKTSRNEYELAVEFTNSLTKNYYDEVRPLIIDLRKYLNEFIQLMISFLKRKNLLD